MFNNNNNTRNSSAVSPTHDTNTHLKRTYFVLHFEPQLQFLNFQISKTCTAVPYHPRYCCSTRYHILVQVLQYELLYSRQLLKIANRLKYGAAVGRPTVSLRKFERPVTYYLVWFKPNGLLDYWLLLYTGYMRCLSIYRMISYRTSYRTSDVVHKIGIIWQHAPPHSSSTSYCTNYCRILHTRIIQQYVYPVPPDTAGANVIVFTPYFG